MERKIGEKFTDNLHTLRVVKKNKNYGCQGCFYNHGALSYCWTDDILNRRGECRIGRRSDNSEVIFKETFISKNIRPITYISIALFTISFWYFIFKIILGI